MEKTIKVSIKNVYGNDLTYPECEQSRIFAKMAGKKTINPQNIKLIKELGYAIVVIAPTLAS